MEKKIRIKEDKPDIFAQARTRLDAISQAHENPEDRLKEIMKKINPFLELIDRDLINEEKISSIKNDLSALSLISDSAEFTDILMKIIEPLLKLKEDNAEKFEEAQAKAMNRAGNFIEINRPLSYGKLYNNIHIHAPAGESVDNKLSLYRDGLKKLAKIIVNDTEVKTVSATSHLVASHPGLFTKMGFTVKKISDEEKK